MSVRRWRRTSPTGKTSSRWVVDLELRRPDGSKKRLRQFPREQTRAAAEKLERRLLAEAFDAPETTLAAPKPVESTQSAPTLRAFWGDYFATHVATNNKPSEQAAKSYIFRRHLDPCFGAQRLDQITSRCIEKFKAYQLTRQSYSPKTINNHLAVLRGALNVAREWGIISKTPRYRELRPREQPVRFLSRVEAAALVAAAEAPYKTMLIVALNTGLRIGELLALQWSDIYFDTKTMVVRRNLWRDQVGSPKSGKSREIALNVSSLEAFRAHPRSPFPWIFSRRDGQPMSHASCRRPLLRACKAANIAPLQWHVLRHTFASHLVANSVPLRDVQRLLGHANYVTTERYTHLLPHAAQNAVERLNFTDS